MAKVSKKKKRHIKYKSVFLFITLLAILILSIFGISKLPITNIWIVGNNFLSDQEIIDLAGLHDYPKISSIHSEKIIKNLEKNVYLSEVKVKRNHFFREIKIIVKENIPVLYYAYDEKTLLVNGDEVTEQYDVPTLINQTPEDVLEELLKKVNDLDSDISSRISEIQYAPTNVDSELFYLTMDDGNTVYINFNSFSKLNDYIDIIRSFNNKKGILHLDSGDYLEIYKED